MHHDLRPEFQRSLQDRRREGVVHDGSDASGPRGRKTGREIGFLQKGISRRLQPQRVHSGREAVQDGIGVGDVDQRQVDAAPLGEFTQPNSDTGVGGRRCDHPPSNGNEVKDSVGRGHPG